MKNNTEIIDRIKLMMSYNSEKTLNENLNILNEGKSTEVDESRSAISKELKALGLGTKETAVISAMGKEFGLADNLIATALTKDLTQLTKELETAVKADLKNGVRQNLGPLAKQASKLKAMKEMASKSQELKKVGKELTTKEITNIIERTKGEAKSMSQKLEGKYTARIAKRAAKNADAVTNTNVTAVESSGNLTKAAEEAKVAGDAKTAEILKNAENEIVKKPSRWERWKAWGERNPKSKKLLYLLGFGGIGYAAYKMLFSDTTPEQAKQLTFSNCAGSLVDDEGTTIKTTTGGDPVLKVTKTGNPEYDSKGGLMLYNNGRVFMVDQSKRGYWSCKGGQTVVAENDLLNEQGAELTDQELDTYVSDAIDDLDGYVAEYNLQSLLDILTALKGKTYKGKSALQEFLRYYKEDEGTDFLADVNSVGVANLSITAKNMKPQIIAMVSGAAKGGDGKSATGVDSIINIKWDGAKSGGGDGGNSGGGGGSKKSGQKYYDCASVNLDTTALTYGCSDKRIAEVQKCLGITADGKFGPATRKALTDNAYDATKGITKEIYTKVLAGCKKGEAAPTTGSTEGGADVNYLRNPIKLDLGPTPELPKFSRNSETGEAFYNRLVANNNFRAGEIGSNRVKYKGTDLNIEDLKKLNDFITSNGYRLIKNKDKGAQYGGGENDKYVWQKAEQ